jgi:hypothetical protein
MDTHPVEFSNRFLRRRSKTPGHCQTSKGLHLSVKAFFIADIRTGVYTVFFFEETGIRQMAPHRGHHDFEVIYEVVSLIDFGGTPEGIRTPGLRIRSPLLYPAELQAHAIMLKGRLP